jgi:hypothetical protein
MKWSQVEQLTDIVLPDLTDRTSRIPKWRSPIVGGMAPAVGAPDDDSPFIEAPAVVIAEFTVTAKGKKPRLIFEGSGLRPVRARDSPDVNLETRLREITFPRWTVELAGKVGEQQNWDFQETNLRAGKKMLLKDPKLSIVATIDAEPSENGLRVKVVVRNTGPDERHSYLHDFKFDIYLEDAEVVIDKKFRRQDTPLHVETINAVADLADDNKLIMLRPFGMWNQKKIENVLGPTFVDAVARPFEVSKGSLGEYEADFKYAASIVSDAIRQALSPALNYYKFQYEIRGRIYQTLVKCWGDDIPRAVIDNAPTASGKSEPNFDTAIVATIVLKRRTPNHDCGTVAVLSTPIRALTAEQLERMFEVTAFTNEKLSDDMKVSIGFYMGTMEGKGVPYEPSKDLEGRIDKVPISNCPFCGSELVLRYNSQTFRLIPECHTCQPNRIYDWVYLTIKETEQFLPNIVVATLDKLCYEEPRNIGVHSFFGREYSRCTHCGRATAITAKVIEARGQCWTCKAPIDGNDIRRSQFSVFIMDEAHTYRGSMGSNASLYTVAELQLAMSVLKRAYLVVASTATVKKSADLMRNLTGAREFDILPDPDIVGDESKYFQERDRMHRKFIFTCANVSNRVGIPKAVSSVKAAWNKVRGPSDPERLPQIVFTKKRQNAENLSNAIQVLGEEEKMDLKSMVIHGESEKPLVKSALEKIRSSEIDVLFVTVDLISLGIDVPSISVIHFDGMPDDFAKFVQAYGRSARGREAEDAGIVFTWLRMNIPGEAYYFEHFRDLFIYKRELMPVVPINRWFSQSIRNYTPAAAAQYGFFTDRRGSVIFSAVVAKRQFTNPVYQNEIQQFMEKMMTDKEKADDFKIAQDNILRGLHDLTNHITAKSLANMQNTRQLLEGIIPYGIRSQSGETLIVPANPNKALMSVRVERSLLSAGYTQSELGLEDD